MMNNNKVEMNNVVFAIANRNGKALMLNGNTNQYLVVDGENSQKASMKAICMLLDKVADSEDRNKVATIIVPKNLAFILRKESVKHWRDNGNKTNTGYELDEEFMELAEYISDMRYYLGNRVKVKMTGTTIVRPEEERVMKYAWNQLDKVTGYKANVMSGSAVISRPSKPAFMCK